MEAAAAIRRARVRAGLTQIRLAEIAGTSQATVSLYESGSKAPSLATLERLLGACGFEIGMRPMPGGRRHDDLAAAGRGLADVLALAEALPFSRPGPLRYPRLPGGLAA